MTDQQIADLIAWPKRIVSRQPARGYQAGNGHKRCDLDLLAVNGRGRICKVFIRQNAEFPECRIH